jgi:hypothetical protein
MGRFAVRDMMASMSRSMYWLTALEPPAANAPPSIVKISVPNDGTPCAAITIAVTVVKTSRTTMRGLVSWM